MNCVKRWMMPVAVVGIFSAAPAWAGFVVFPSNGHSYEVVTDSASGWTQADAAARREATW